DGATFRLTRTRSNHRMLREDQSSLGMDAPDRWWDWVGQGWMAGENPILLIDAATPDLIGDGPRTTWLWLDAHHSIPFQMVYHVSGGTATVTYEAPARFRARMTHNGVAAPSSNGNVWAVRPTQFDVWLYDGQIRYTFVAVNEDVPPNRWNHNSLNEVVHEGSANPDWRASSYHDRPFTRNQLKAANVSQDRLQNHDPFTWFLNPGFGVPHYGLCVRVADQFGHEVRISHAPSARWTVDRPDTPCVETWQDAAARGQIQYLKLLSQGQVKWTLIYAHRRFAADGWIAQPGNGERYRDMIDSLPEATRRVLFEQFGTSAIDRIYVFQGDVPDSVLEPAVLVQHSTETPGLSGGVDPLTEYNANRPSGAPALPTAWAHRVRYHYVPDAQGRPVSPPILAMTTVATGAAAAPQGSPTAERRTVYVHRLISPNEPGGDRAFRRLPWLECIFTEDDLQRALGERSNPSDPLTWLTLDHLARWIDGSGDPIVWDASTESLSHRLARHATVRLSPARGEPWPQSSASFETPSESGLLSRYTLPAEKVWPDNEWFGTVGRVALGGITQGQQTFRINRLVVPPDPGPGTRPIVENPLASSQVHANLYLARSAFVQPFAWQATMPRYDAAGPSDDALAAFAQSPSLQTARWVSIIDEMPASLPTTSGGAPSLEYPEATTPYDAATGLKPGQRSRRIVEINAAGFVLRDRRWDFDQDGAAVTGGGVGEDFVYASVADVFPAQAEPLPPTVRNEMLLLQHRTAGWSVADRLSVGNTQGLINFRAYELVDDADAPGGKRVQLAGSGIQRGSAPGAPRCYESKTFIEWDEEQRVEIRYDFRFLTCVGETEYAALTSPGGVRQSTLDSVASAGAMTLTLSMTWRSGDADPEQPDLPARQKRIVKRTVISPPRVLRPGHAEAGLWHYPVQREWYDQRGNATWSATGLLRSPLEPASEPGVGDALIFTYTHRYAEGWGAGMAEHVVVDAAPGNAVSTRPATPPFTVPPFPESGWQRIGATPPLQAVTTFDYDDRGPCDTYFHDGRRQARRFTVVSRDSLPAPDNANAALPEWLGRDYIFNDLVPVGGGYSAASAGEVRDYLTLRPVGSPFKTRGVEFTGTIDLSSYLWPFTELASVRLAIDAFGRARRAEVLERVPGYAGPVEVGHKEINDLGEVLRELEMDGNITRTTRNPLGQALRRYVGTQDEGWVPQPPNQPDARPYNMILVERTDYGAGVHDVWLPAVARRYTPNPSWARDHHGDAPVADPDGIATRTSYDWRMRPVKIERFGRGDPGNPLTPRLGLSITVPDHLGRQRLAVTFGADAPALPPSLDPTTFGPGSATPSAADYLALSPRPISITESFYEPDGGAFEQRTYDVAWSPAAGGTPPYHATFTFRGFAGQEV
ncbi:MAG: hypothetical protein JNJ48_06675, partial [Phycisphaerae bacterium]|nr:hypothetical protein [Phycisphaerae bacterium]